MAPDYTAPAARVGLDVLPRGIVKRKIMGRREERTTYLQQALIFLFSLSDVPRGSRSPARLGLGLRPRRPRPRPRPHQPRHSTREKEAQGKHIINALYQLSSLSSPPFFFLLNSYFKLQAASLIPSFSHPLASIMTRESGGGGEEQATPCSKPTLAVSTRCPVSTALVSERPRSSPLAFSSIILPPPMPASASSLALASSLSSCPRSF